MNRIKNVIPVLIVEHESHIHFFSQIITGFESSIVYDEKSKFINQIEKITKTSEVVSEVSIDKTLKHYTSLGFTPVIMVPADLTGAIDTWYSQPVLRDCYSIALANGVIDPDWVINLNEDNRREKFSNIAKLFSAVILPENNSLLYLPGTNVFDSGFLGNIELSLAPRKQVLIVLDFNGYESADTSRWVNDVKQSLDNHKTTYKIVQTIPVDGKRQISNIPCSDYEDILRDIGEASIIITPQSHLYFVARSIGINAVIYDPWKFSPVACDRDLSLSGAYIRYKRDLIKVLSPNYYELNEESKSSVNVLNNNEGLSDLNKIIQTNISNVNSINQIEEYREHIVLWGRMPPYNYSGGRYHGWLIAEGLTDLGFEVTLVTDNCPYFIDDFAHLPNHNRIKIHTIENFENTSNFPKSTASLVIVIPGMDRLPTLYKGAISYAELCDAKLGLVNFESPNWFNSIVSPKRDEKLWQYWESISHFCSLLLSTTKESKRYAKEYYLSAPPDALHEHLYAPINSFYSDKYQSIENKEKRVIVFFPRHGYSAHKGWQSIVDCIDSDFLGHTIVFLCGESDLPQDVMDSLHQLSTDIGFNIEYKVKINDEQKFIELSRACLLIFPSQFEGYGYPPVEALAVGTPCVAFDLPVLRETCGESLLYAPVGDWQTFKELCNSALRNNYRLTVKDVEQAKKIAHFSSFTKKLDGIVQKVLATDSVWSTSSASDSDLKSKVDKAFFDTDKLKLELFKYPKPSISGKAIVKNIMTDFLTPNEVEVERLSNEPRVLILIKSIKELNEVLANNTLIDYVKYTILKGIKIDIVCEDFAIELLGSSLDFSNIKYISVGTVKDDCKLRSDVCLMLLHLYKQYNICKVVTVDGYLSKEINYLKLVGGTPSIDWLVNNNDVNVNFSLTERVLVNESKVKLSTSKYKEKYVSVPFYILPTLDRKKWLVTSEISKTIAIYIDPTVNSLNRIISFLDNLVEKLAHGVSVIFFGSVPKIKLPYYASIIQVKNNNDLYNLLKKSKTLINCTSNDDVMSSFIETYAHLVGCHSFSLLSNELHHSKVLIKDIPLIFSNEGHWKDKRRENFNQVINNIAQPSLLEKLFSYLDENKYDFIEGLTLYDVYEAEKESINSNSEPALNRCFTLVQHSLDEGCLKTAIEGISRYLHSNPKAIVMRILLIELAISEGMHKEAGYHISIINKSFPFEALSMVLNYKYKYSNGDSAGASQCAYYGLMLGQGSIQSITCAAKCSIIGSRQIDKIIHNLIVKYVIENNKELEVSASKSELNLRFINALLKEGEEDENT
jgi:glycosyltransferase involved in cell wall biosynthesis